MGQSKAKEYIEVRREKVAKMYFLYQMSQREIAKEVNVHLNTVWHDVEVIRKRNAEEYKRGGWDNYIAGFKMNTEKRKQTLWRILNNLSDEKKIQCIEAMRNEDIYQLKLLQDIGVLPTQPQQNINYNVNVEEEWQKKKEIWITKRMKKQEAQ